LKDNETVLKRLHESGVVPVAVIENAEDAVPTANALLAGGMDVIEITFRTAAAPESIRAVSRECPSMLVGAGTVTNVEQCIQAVELGANFIVSPGFDEETVQWCVKNGITITPGCVTPTEIMKAIKLGLKVLKFFPSNVYGGLGAMRTLSGPFGGVKFIPTGGVNADNLSEYVNAPFVHAVGGSWLCTKGDITSGNFERITALCCEARKTVLGFELAHVGINAQDTGNSLAVCEQLSAAFGFETAIGNSSNFAGTGMEVMNSPSRGTNGHIAVYTSSIPRAMTELAKREFLVDEKSVKYKDGRMIAVYLCQEFGGFAVHLLQK
jgi:2-dehydro-3-deoxyphosphogluconate aldolase/(4S)-4-hydroxy-2-oxoglutarate aldolase